MLYVVFLFHCFRVKTVVNKYLYFFSKLFKNCLSSNYNLFLAFDGLIRFPYVLQLTKRFAKNAKEVKLLVAFREKKFAKILWNATENFRIFRETFRIFLGFRIILVLPVVDFIFCFKKKDLNGRESIFKQIYELFDVS